ncbi:MAG: hypothetical protein U1D66_14845 [Erythrobacter sp.]|nr:hypothetical protein [Erythrobacter sp.]
MGKSLITRVTLFAGLPLAACLGLVALAAHAQGRDPGGPRLTFGITQRFESTENLDLDVNSAGRTNQATTGLSFGLLSETQTTSFGLDAGGILRAVDQAGGGSDVSFDDKRLGLRYSHSGANTTLTFGANLREARIEFLRPLEDFIDENGVIVLPDDLDQFNGTGKRQNYTLNAGLDWGKGGPWGFGVNARYNQLTYTNTSSPSLFDSNRWTVGGNLRFAIDPATEARFSLSQSRFRDDDPTSDTRDTLHFGLDLTRDRPSGAINTSFSADDTEDGTRLNLTFGHDFTLPTGALSVNLGISRSADGDISPSGNLAWQQSLPNGAINARLQSSVISGTDDTDRLVTSLSLGVSRELSALSSLNLNLAWADSESTSGGDSTTNASVGATYTHMLTEDWGMDLGYNHRLRDTSAGTANSDTVFLALRRTFDLRP